MRRNRVNSSSKYVGATKVDRGCSEANRRYCLSCGAVHPVKHSLCRICGYFFCSDCASSHRLHPAFLRHYLRQLANQNSDNEVEDDTESKATCAHEINACAEDNCVAGMETATNGDGERNGKGNVESEKTAKPNASAAAGSHVKANDVEAKSNDEKQTTKEVEATDEIDADAKDKDRGESDVAAHAKTEVITGAEVAGKDLTSQEQKAPNSLLPKQPQPRVTLCWACAFVWQDYQADLQVMQEFSATVLSFDVLGLHHLAILYLFIMRV